MRVVANGASLEIPEQARLTDLFDQLGLGARWVVAEVNGEAIERSRMSQLELRDGDRVEIVRAVAGG